MFEKTPGLTLRPLSNRQSKRPSFYFRILVSVILCARKKLASKDVNYSFSRLSRFIW